VWWSACSPSPPAWSAFGHGLEFLGSLVGSIQTGQTLCPNTRLTKCVSFFLEPVGNMGLRPYKVLFLKKFEHFSKLEKFIFAAHYYIDNN
jgi:hypothetical protein